MTNFIVVKNDVYEAYVHHPQKFIGIDRASKLCTDSAGVYRVLKCVATITPKGVTVDDHEKEEE